MHIVFLVGSYYPNYSAVGKCVGNVADLLAKKHKVTVICEKNSLNQTFREVFNNQDILRFITSDMTRRFKIIDQIKREKGWKKRMFQLNLSILKLKQVLKFLFSKLSIKQDMISCYIDALKSIDNSIDVIIPASMPFESVIAASQYKMKFKRDVILIPYLFDKFTDSKTLHRLRLNWIIKRKAHINLENDVLNNADKIIAMNTLKRFYINECSKLNQIIFLEHPLLVQNNNENTSSLSSIKLTYIGGFYKNYVEPDYLLRLFYKSKIDARLELYIIGNRSQIINKYVKLDNRRIFNYGSVDKETAMLKLAENSILVSVAEKSGLQLSSKIFDYISTGKPIIHFYNSENDVNKTILERYPIALCIKEEKQLLSQNINEFEEFCLNNSGKIISWDIIREIYPEAIPEYTVSIIESYAKGETWESV